ncbi:MAG: hypothetical protein JST00_33965 [Deltaproteobacteria bacterium]|nr:hypothetical protein [Deltaproteobacteria bacterium]
MATHRALPQPMDIRRTSRLCASGEVGTIIAFAPAMDVHVFESAGLSVARFERGAVVLRASPGTIFELSEPAAIALDVLLDRPTVSMQDEEALRSARDALPFVRSEVFDERTVQPRGSISVDDRGGRPLIRRHHEPLAWSNNVPSTRGRVVVDATVARVDGGALLVIGDPRARGPLVDGLALAGVEVMSSSRVVLGARGSEVVVRAGYPDSIQNLREVWHIAEPPSPSLHLVRNKPSAALTDLLESACARVDSEAFDVLARVSVGAPFFRVAYPRNADQLRACVRAFPSLRSS